MVLLFGGLNIQVNKSTRFRNASNTRDLNIAIFRLSGVVFKQGLTVIDFYVSARVCVQNIQCACTFDVVLTSASMSRLVLN